MPALDRRGAERSPWKAALGDALHDLHPQLAAYFSAIPAGHVGRGTGTFDSVGTPRRWAWPALWLLSFDGVAFPVWERGVEFTLENRPDDGDLRSTRTFAFPNGERVMSDAISNDGPLIVDRLGRHGRLEARLMPSVEGGALVLRSTSTRFRLGRLRLPVPFAPRVELVESAAGPRQRVTLTMTAPIVGRIYEYIGEFDYAVVPE